MLAVSRACVRPSYYSKTVSILRTFFLAMALHPDVLEKAQEEINRVVGKERLPDTNDREGLPYLECLLQEVYRFVPRRFLHDLPARCC